MRLEQKSYHALVMMLVAFLLVTGLNGCAGAISTSTDGDAVPQQALQTTAEPITLDTVSRPEGWSEKTHGDAVEPNYDVVFPDDRVNQIKITIDPEDWEAMQANMVDLFGESGVGRPGRGFPGGLAGPEGGLSRPGGFERPEGAPPEPGENGLPEGFEPPQGRGQAPPAHEGAPGGHPGAGGLGGGDMTPENPMWVPATIEFEGKTWTNVGVRYKGNSSLTDGWRSGTLKLPLKLDFDEFEDEHPEIDDQRFYGFKQLSLSNGFSDNSFLRDAATSAILEEAGLPVAKTAFYQVVLDHGEGPVTLGLYVAIEVVDDTVVQRCFGSDEGNIYEGEGAAASFAASTYDQIEQSFQKENNQERADWSDIESLFDVLHDEGRASDSAAWRTDLESVFDVDGFLEWLAISAVIQHWDAYGNMSHNYYLYHDPASGQVKWISWDHNMAMSAGRGRGSVSLDKAEVNDKWPLIRYLLDDPVYYDLYLDYLQETIEGAFEPGRMAQIYQTWAELIEPYAVADVGQEAFEAAIQELVDHACQRVDAVQAFLATSGQTP